MFVVRLELRFDLRVDFRGGKNGLGFLGRFFESSGTLAPTDDDGCP
jgi:hypothetical protein